MIAQRHAVASSPHLAPDARGDTGGLVANPRRLPDSHTTPAPPQVAQVFPDRASASMCRTGAGIGVARLPGRPRRRFVRCARVDAECHRYRRRLGVRDEQLYGTMWTTWMKLIRVTRRPQAAATARRRRRRIAEPTLRGVQPVGMKSRRPGLEPRPQDSGSDNVNGDDPNRDPRLRPSARRLEKETATRAGRLWRSARRHGRCERRTSSSPCCPRGTT